MNHRPGLDRSLLFGVFFIAMGMLLQEIMLTRIFSVTMFYHFAFMVVSITLFGIGVSGIFVYLNPALFTRERAAEQMTAAAALFALAIPVSFILQTHLPAAPDSPRWGWLYLTLTYVLIAVPFFLGGTAISLALTHHSRSVSTLYFADLVGASIGCALVFPGLTLMRGPDMIALVGVIGGLAAVAFSSGAGRGARRMAGMILILTMGIFGLNSSGAYRLLTTTSVRMRIPESDQLMAPLAVKWNPMSRVVAFDHSTRPVYRPGQDPDSTFYPPGQVLYLLDKSAMTWTVGFDGDWKKVDWIYTDVSTMPLWVHPGAKVLDIGSGGGQHALAAIGLGSKDITCVEINPTVVEWTRTRFDRMSGHIYNRPEVRVFVGDGRTFTARSKEKYDVISFVSSTTFTATTSGAFMMAENNLFTREAFRAYLDHLTPDGLIGVSQVMTVDYPGLLLRMTSLARAALHEVGEDDPARHIVVIMKRTGGYGCMAAKRSPFTDAELDTIDAKARLMGWTVLCSPRVNNHPQFHEVLTRPDFEEWSRSLPLNLYPPTDDKPFFFNLVPFRYLQTTSAGDYDVKYGKLPAQILLNLFFIVLVLTVLFLIVPLGLARRARLPHLPGTVPTLGYFGMLGLGFIMVEVPLLQRFVLYLGHPVYAITTILFSILLFSGIGSFLTRHVGAAGARGWVLRVIPALLALLLAYNLSLEKIFHLTQEQSQAGKIAVSVLLLLPLGLLMGMPFPSMMKRVAEWAPTAVPWCWGVNGATSVLGSVSVVIVALACGFSASLWCGMAAYAIALVFAALLPTGGASPKV